MLSMSKTRYSTLELFLLSLMSGGEPLTPYNVLQRLGISPGASIPALKRLEERQLVKKERPAARGRQAFSITKQGDDWLDSHINLCMHNEIDNPPLDAESIARNVALALSEFPGFTFGKRLVKATFKKCVQRAKQAEEEVYDLDRKHSRGTTEEIYRWVRASLEAAQWRAEAAALKQIHSEVRDRERN